MSENIPDNLYYTKTHEWVRIEQDTAVVGITDFAVEQMNKEIVNVDLPEVGLEVKQEESFGIIDSVKAAFDLYAPLSGEIIEVNEFITSDPTIVANSPYDQGWMIKIKIKDNSELGGLLKAEDYRKLTETPS